MAKDTAASKRQFRQRKRKRDIETAILAEIEERAIGRDWSAAKIHKFLEEGIQDNKWAAADVPTLRTVQRVVRDLKTEEEAGPWTLTDSMGEDARHVLDVLPIAILHSEGAKTTLTQEEAKWIVKLKKARPEMPPLLIWLLARFYMVYNAKRIDTWPLDAYLALRPWEPDEGRRSSFKVYLHLVFHKLIPLAPAAIMWYTGSGSRGWHRGSMQSHIESLAKGTMTLIKLDHLRTKVEFQAHEVDLEPDEIPYDWFK